MPPPPGRRTLSHLHSAAASSSSSFRQCHPVARSSLLSSSLSRPLRVIFLSPILFVSLIYFSILDCSFLKRVCIYILCLYYAPSLTNVFGLLFGVKFISFSLLHVVPLAV